MPRLLPAADPLDTGPIAGTPGDEGSRAVEHRRGTVGGVARGYRFATEAQEQATVIAWANHAQRRWPELELLFHPPNGEVRDPRTAAKLKWLGVRPGVPDLILPVARGGAHGLAIEIKRRHGGVTSEAQRKYLNALLGQGWRVEVCYGADEAIAELRRYLSGSAEGDPWK